MPRPRYSRRVSNGCRKGAEVKSKLRSLSVTRSRVCDRLAGLLTSDEEEAIEQRLWDVEQKSGVEVAVVVIRSIQDYAGTQNGSIEQFAKELFNRYGIGNLPKNDGVLLLVAKDDRKARIELGGWYGHSYDHAANQILDQNLIPRFKSQQYALGIHETVQSITNGFTTSQSKFAFGGLQIGQQFLKLLLLLIAAILLGFIAYSLFKNGKRGWGWWWLESCLF